MPSPIILQEVAISRVTIVQVSGGCRCEGDTGEDEYDECKEQLDYPERYEDLFRPDRLGVMLALGGRHLVCIDGGELSMVVLSPELYFGVVQSLS